MSVGVRCDQCGLFVPADIFMSPMKWPLGWIALSIRADNPAATPDLKADLCSWNCVATYAMAKYEAQPTHI